MRNHHSEKRRICLLLVLAMILGMLPLSVFAGEDQNIQNPLPENTFYVSAEGDDDNGDGTVEAPFQSLQAAYEAIGSEGTIALLSDLYLTGSEFDDDYAALYISDGKDITLTSADEDGMLVENAAGTMKGVHTIHRWNKAKTSCYAGNMIYVDEGNLTLRQIVLDGGAKNFVATNGHGYLIFAPAEYGDDVLTLDTNCVLQDNIDLGEDGSPCGSGIVFGTENCGTDPVMYMKDNAAIIGCIAPRHGGALTVYDGDFYMMDDTVMMYNGIKWIGDKYYGGSAILAYRGHVHMSGNALITRNFVNVPEGKDSGRQHNAVQADPNTASILYISGNARIFDNYDGTDTSLTKSGSAYTLVGTKQANAYGAAGKFYVDGAMGSGAKIGVTVKDGTSGSTVVCGSGYNITDADADAFFDDTNTYKVAMDNTNKLILSGNIDVTTLTLNTVTASAITGTFGKDIGAVGDDFSVYKNGVKMDDGYSITIVDTDITISFDEDLEGYDEIAVAVYKNGCKVNGGGLAEITMPKPAEIKIGTFKMKDNKFYSDIELAGRMKTYSVSITGGKIYLTSASGKGYAFKNGVVSTTTGHATPNTSSAYTSVQLEITAENKSIDAVAEKALESLRYTSTDGETFTVEIAGGQQVLRSGDYYINGHYYTLSASIMPWKSAMEWAFNLQTTDSTRYPGYKSYPAVITSPEENQMLVTIWAGNGSTRRQIWLPAVPANPKDGSGSISVSGEAGARTVTVTGEPQARVITNEYGHGEAYVWLDGTPEAGQPLPNETPLMGTDANKTGYYWSSGNPTNGGSVYFGHPGQGALWDDISDTKGYKANVWTGFSGNSSFKMYALTEWEPIGESNDASATRTFSHKHNWSYTEDGDTITASCTAKDCYLEEPYYELTISEPVSLICNGRYKGAIIDASVFGPYTFDGSDIVYEKKEGGTFKPFSGVPYTAGTYRASISAGSVTASVSYTLTTPGFTATQGALHGNFAELEWEGTTGSKYMIEKAGEDNKYQSISLKTTIKVLNVYPDAGDNLKTWMDTNKLGSPTIDGVKYSMTVDKVSISSFNSNPSAYLGTAGKWKYDVVFFGAWDSNNGKDISNAAYSLTDTFIRCGGGVLLGHDTAYPGHPCFAQLAVSYLDFATNSNIKTYGHSQVRITKKGTLTNYPYNIGEPGTLLNIPMCHTTYQFVTSGVWMEFSGSSWGNGAMMTNYGGKDGTNTFYLASKNNVAMIQTGHSGGSATLDEQKVLVNTLYYLAQSSEVSSFSDHSAQDLAAPDAITGGAIAANHFNFTAPKDNGSSYTYKLYGLDDSTGEKLFTGAETSVTVKTGLAGYSYILSSSAGKVGVDNTIEAAEPSIDLSAYEGGTCYLHIVAVDGAGNPSEEKIFDITHVHEWSYSSTGSSILATCADTLGTCRAKTADKVETILAPVNPVYNQLTHPASLSSNHIGSVTGLSKSNITYEKQNEDESFSAITGEPVEPGVYRATIQAAGQSASVIYRVRNWNKDLAASMFTFEAPESLTYDKTGKDAAVEVKEAYEDLVGTIGTIRYQKVGETTWTTNPTEAGTYTVWVDIADNGEIYAGGEGINFPNWTFTIDPRETTASWTDTTQVFTGTELHPEANLNNIVEGDVVNVSGITRTEAGSYNLTAEIDNPNYTLTNPITPFVIQKAPVHISVDNVIIPYDGQPGQPTITAEPVGQAGQGGQAGQTGQAGQGGQAGQAGQSGQGGQAGQPGQGGQAGQPTIAGLDEEDYRIIYKDKDGNVVEDPTEPGTYFIYAVITNDNYRFDNSSDGKERRISTLTIYGNTAPSTYTISFIGGEDTTGKMDALDPVVAGDIRTLPACGFTKAGYSFAGWRYENRLYKAGETFTQPGSDVSLAAQWSNNVFTIGGIVLDGEPVGDAVVTIMSGSRQVSQQVTDEDGSFTFEGVLPGTYNLVISYDGIIVTHTIVVTNASICGLNISLPAGRTNSVVEVAAGSPEIVVTGLPENFDCIGGNFTQEDVQTVADGGSVEIKMSLSENSCPDQAKQEKLLAKAPHVALYLDANLAKTVTEADGTIGEPQALYTSDSLLTLVIPVPAELQAMASYSVFRFHSPDGTEEKEVLEELRRLSAGEAGTREGYVVSEDKTYVTVYAREFSLYAVCYSESDTTRRQVNIPQDIRGTVTVSPARAAHGKRVTVTVDPRDGYTATGIVVTTKNGRNVAVTHNGDGTYAFIMPAMEVYIEVLYSRALASLEMTGVSDWLITDRNVPYMSGYTDGSVRPETTITRAETAMIFYKLLKQKDMDTESTFGDVDEDQWYGLAVDTLAAMGIISGYTDGSFRPDDAITRAEFTSIAMKFANATGEDAHFSDVKSDFWAEASILTAATYGWINGYADGTFRPDEAITRAEVAVIVNKMLCRSTDNHIALAAGSVMKEFVDLNDNTKWYYKDMVAATNEFEYYAAVK